MYHRFVCGSSGEKSNNIAHLALDFRHIWSVHAVPTKEQTMDPAAADDVTKALLHIFIASFRRPPASPRRLKYVPKVATFKLLSTQPIGVLGRVAVD